MLIPVVVQVDAIVLIDSESPDVTGSVEAQRLARSAEAGKVIDTWRTASGEKGELHALAACDQIAVAVSVVTSAEVKGVVK